jgi:hypothetical protein
VKEVMKRNWSVSLDADRYRDFLPFLGAAILVAAIAMQATLMPVKPTAIGFPPTADETVTPGALPQFSVPPDVSAERNTVQTTVLPTEAAPAEPEASLEPPSTAMAPPDIAAPFAAENAPPLAARGAPVAVGLPLGAGNLHIRTSRQLALSSLATNLMRQIEQLQAARRQTLEKRPATLKPVRPPVLPAGRTLKETGAAGPAVPGVGGPAPRVGVLGGPLPLVGKDAPVIDGTTLRRRF